MATRSTSPQKTGSTSEDELTITVPKKQAMGAATGAVVGGMMAGPIGAVVGGAIGTYVSGHPKEVKKAAATSVNSLKKKTPGVSKVVEKVKGKVQKASKASKRIVKVSTKAAPRKSSGSTKVSAKSAPRKKAGKGKRP